MEKKVKESKKAQTKFEVMVTISAKEVNELRQKTGSGMMDCKKALVESGGDFDKAIDILRKKGQKVSEARSGRDF